MLDIYGDSQLDPVTQEYVLVYVAGVLARDRKARRSPEFRSKPGEKKGSGAELVKHAWNKRQLVALAESCLQRGSSFTRADVNAARVRAVARKAEQKKLREGRFKGRLLGEWTIDQILEESECEDGEKEYLVRWLAYDGDDTWEPREVVEDTEALDVWEARDLDL